MFVIGLSFHLFENKYSRNIWNNFFSDLGFLLPSVVCGHNFFEGTDLKIYMCLVEMIYKDKDFCYWKFLSKLEFLKYFSKYGVLIFFGDGT